MILSEVEPENGPVEAKANAGTVRVTADVEIYVVMGFSDLQALLGHQCEQQNEISHLKSELADSQAEKGALERQLRIQSELTSDLRHSANLSNQTARGWSQKAATREKALLACAALNSDENVHFIIQQTLSPVV
jgi:hypothetical protein